MFIFFEQTNSLPEVEQSPSLHLSGKDAYVKLTPWLQATLYESSDIKECGKHLAAVGIIAEPYWSVIGPFESNNFDAVFQEKLIQAVFTVGGVAKEFPWRETNDNLIDGYVDCVKVMESIEEVYGYALTVIESPSQRLVQIRVAYDDYITVWLNGEKLLETSGGSPCIYDDVIVDTALRAGQNRLLVKIGNLEPGWGFLIRITDVNGVAFDDLSYRLLG